MSSTYKFFFILIFLVLGVLGNRITSGQGSLKSRILGVSFDSTELPVAGSSASTDELKDEGNSVIQNTESQPLSAERISDLENLERKCLSDQYSKIQKSDADTKLAGFWKVTSYTCENEDPTESLVGINKDLKEGRGQSYWQVQGNRIITKNSFQMVGLCISCGEAQYTISENDSLSMTYQNRSRRCSGKVIEEDGLDILNKQMDLKYKISGKKAQVFFPQIGHSKYFAQWCKSGSFIVDLEIQ